MPATEATLNEAVGDRRAENRFALLLCPLVLVVSLLKGLDGISYWGATQALVDYRFGLVKRGLLGALLARPLHFERIAHFYIFSLLVLAALLGLLIAFGLYGGLRERFATQTLLPLYLSSYAITFFAYCLGYNDLLLFCFVIPLLFLRNSTARLIAALPIAIVCVLLHEIFLFLVLPLLLLSFLLEMTLSEDRAVHRALFVKAAVLLVLSLGATFRVALRPSLSPIQIAQLRADFAHRADFPLNAEVTELMGRSASDNMRLLWQNAHTSSYWKRQAGTLLTMWPNTFVLCFCIVLALRSVDRPVESWLHWACFATALSPLMLHLLAWDADRWNAETITTSLLVLVLICRYTRGAVVEFSPKLRYAILFLIVFNISVRAVVMEGHEVANSKPWMLLKSRS
jgi:hypothetical protein